MKCRDSAKRGRKRLMPGRNAGQSGPCALAIGVQLAEKNKARWHRAPKQAKTGNKHGAECPRKQPLKKNCINVLTVRLVSVILLFAVGL